MFTLQFGQAIVSRGAGLASGPNVALSALATDVLAIRADIASSGEAETAKNPKSATANQ